MDNPLVQPDPGLYIWTIVTFLVLVAALARFAWRPLLRALDQRQESIRKSLDDAQKARQELERLQGESARMLAEARVEADAIISRTRSDADRVRDELKQKAQAEAAGLIRNAERQIELETARALQQIRSEAVDISLAIASRLLQRNVTKEDNERLIEETFRELEMTQAQGAGHRA
jgi:F-type H+-transporting ATPase subunit b